MPKNAFYKYRYDIIDGCLRNTAVSYTLELLLEKVNEELRAYTSISKATLKKDLDDLKLNYNAPIVCKKIGREWIYSYSDIDFTIKNDSFSQEDSKKVRNVINLLRQLSHLPLAIDLIDSVKKLELRVEQKNELTNTPVILTQNEHYKGAEFISDLFTCITECRTVKATYQPFHKPSQTFIFHPYLLKEYNQRWFVIGHNSAKAKLENLALDRIQELKISKEPFYLNSKFDAFKYKGQMIGISFAENSMLEIVKLRFSKERAPYFATKPFVQITESKTLPNGKVDFTFKIYINKELEA